MLPKVFVETGPLLIMIWSAIEVFKRECLGILLGHRPTPKNPNFFIMVALPLQSVRRGSQDKAFNEVEQTGRSYKRSREFEKLLEACRIFRVGDFHSHAEYGGLVPREELSRRDKKFMCEDMIEILMSISSRRQKKPWAVFPDGRVGGSFGRYDFLFSAYMLEKESGDKSDGSDEKREAHLLEIIAPAAIKFFNRIQQKR